MTSPSVDAEAARRHHAAFARLLAGQPGGLGVPQVPAFVAWAERHRLAPYASWLARSSDAGLAEALKPARLKAALASIAREGPLRDILTSALGAGATPVLFKGVGVAQLCYPSSDLRPLGDVDLLVPRPELQRFVDAAMALGYRYEHEDPAVVAYYWDWTYAVCLVHPRIGLLEAHHGLYRDCEPAFVAAILDRAWPTTLLGLSVRCLDPCDLFVVLAVHWGISRPGSLWVWLLDLVLLGRTFDAAAWERVAEVARRHGLQLFVVAALRTMERLWGVRHAAGPAWGLERDLRVLEKGALARLPDFGSGAVTPGDALSVARRLSGRPVAGSLGLLSSLFCHPGAVCEDLGVSSRSPWFWWHRVRHVGRRLSRALRAI